MKTCRPIFAVCSPAVHLSSEMSNFCTDSLRGYEHKAGADGALNKTCFTAPLLTAATAPQQLPHVFVF